MIDKGQWRESGKDTGVTPLLFTRSAMGFLVSTESQDLGLMSPTATSFSQEVSHPDADQDQPCLASMGNQSWATG